MLYHALRAGLEGRLPMHMPGHKRNAALAPYLQGLGAALDITEIEGFDNLHAPEDLLKDAMARAARLYGTHSSLYLVNGATAGILAGIRALTKAGDTILMERGSHLSVHQGTALCRLKPRYLNTPNCPKTGIPGLVTPNLLEEALRENPGTVLVELTCPTYQGLLCDLPALVRMVHQHGARVLVDAAHGAHLGLNPAFPAGAVQSGADLVVHSLHKTLPSLTQTALLHARDEALAQAAAEQLDVFQTSSPSYLLMASIDGCVDLLTREGERLLPAWHDILMQARADLGSLKRLSLWSGGLGDPSKVVISCAEADINGYQLSDMLSHRYGIDLEMAQERYVLAMGGLGDTADGWRRLTQALMEVDGELAFADKPAMAPLPQAEAAMLPHEALELPSVDAALDCSQGAVSAEYVVAYPPGVPLLVPGEVVTQAVLARALSTPRLMKTRTKHQPHMLRTVDKL